MTSLRRQLGLAAVMAVVMGDMLGSGIFFTPGELAQVADSPWQVYFMWSLCGLIVLCGALTLGELASLIPRAGATYHILSEGFGPAWGFVKAWMEAWVSAPGSIAGVAIVFGEFVVQFLGDDVGSAQLWAILAVAVLRRDQLVRRAVGRPSPGDADGGEDHGTPAPRRRKLRARRSSRSDGGERGRRRRRHRSSSLHRARRRRRVLHVRRLGRRHPRCRRGRKPEAKPPPRPRFRRARDHGFSTSSSTTRSCASCRFRS